MNPVPALPHHRFKINSYTHKPQVEPYVYKKQTCAMALVANCQPLTAAVHVGFVMEKVAVGQVFL
jgi:hypothetical protein